MLPSGDDLRRTVLRDFRVLGPLALVWLVAIFLDEYYGDRLRDALPEWVYSLGYSIEMIGALIPFLALLGLPFVIYVAIVLRSERRLALPCWLFAAFGVSMILAGLEGPEPSLGHSLAWPLLAATGIAATWVGYHKEASG